MIKASALILAAGLSKRAKTDKQFYKINGKYLIQHTVEKFIKIDEISEIILVLSKKNIKKYAHIFSNEKIKLVEGGKTRMESFTNASKNISNSVDVIIVHDGARPFVSTKLIKKIIYSSKKYSCAIPVIPLKDTIKEINLKTLTVIKTVERSKYFAVQTPQGYSYKVFKKIISQKIPQNLTDDSQLAELLRIKIHTIEGEETNIKITTPIDLKIAGVIYEEITKTKN
ncbi:MAG: 2-C-methyl-D-erythritol 4-phosphate cytidylyltransferase [Endomicrobia bacterium]|nr:2-C-methyl-D-erythritol 4-phosphate cytidylyltransferase [Endomicrobiia bacterium]